MSGVSVLGPNGGPVPFSATCATASSQTDLPTCCGSYIITLLQELDWAKSRIPHTEQQWMVQFPPPPSATTPVQDTEGGSVLPATMDADPGCLQSMVEPFDQLVKQEPELAEMDSCTTALTEDVPVTEPAGQAVIHNAADVSRSNAGQRSSSVPSRGPSTAQAHLRNRELGLVYDSDDTTDTEQSTLTAQEPDTVSKSYIYVEPPKEMVPQPQQVVPPPLRQRSSEAQEGTVPQPYREPTARSQPERVSEQSQPHTTCQPQEQPELKFDLQTLLQANRKWMVRFPALLSGIAPVRDPALLATMDADPGQLMVEPSDQQLVKQERVLAEVVPCPSSVPEDVPVTEPTEQAVTFSVAESSAAAEVPMPSSPRQSRPQRAARRRPSTTDSSTKPVVTEKVPNKRRLHYCAECDRAFHTLTSRAVHMRVHKRHTKESRHRCQECGLVFSLLDSLKIHKTVMHSRGKPPRCRYCSRDFIYMSAFQRKKHLQSHNRDKF